MTAVSGARFLSRPTNLFVYGTLMDPALVYRLTGRSLRRESAVLTGYRKVLPQGGYAYVVPDPHGRVDGFVLRDVDDATLHVFDRYEDEGHLYQRTEVLVSVAGRTEPAMTYVGLTELLIPS